MSWEGKPKWNGKFVDVEIESYKFFPMKDDMPLFVFLEGTEDVFFMLFSDEKKLRDVSGNFCKKLKLSEKDLEIGVITNQKFLDALIEEGVRIMCDPIIIDDNHTRWIEMVRHGDIYKYVDVENN